MKNIWGESPQIPGVKRVSYRQDNLIAGWLHLVTDDVTLQKGQGILARGTVLGKTDSELFVLSKATATDGSQEPVAILLDTYDTTQDDVVGAGVYFTGEFNSKRIIFDKSWDKEKLKISLRKHTIFLKDVVSADDPT